MSGIVWGTLFGLWFFGERWHLLMKSTRRLFKAWGWRNIIHTIHAYIYMRWSNQYITFAINFYLPLSRFRIMRAFNQKFWAHRYHGKVITHEHARKIITLNRDVELRNMEHVLPYKKARDFILEGVPDIAVYECACRAARENPCQPTQVCMMMGQPFVDFLLEHNPDTARRISRMEALALLKAEHERGHTHIAFFKDAMLDGFYAICNCCSCCCGGIDAMMHHDAPVLTGSGFVAAVNADACTGCGRCAKVCPFDAVHMDGKAQIDWVRCMGCGVCVDKCPAGALALARDEAKGTPLDVALLSQ